MSIKNKVLNNIHNQGKIQSKMSHREKGRLNKNGWGAYYIYL